MKKTVDIIWWQGFYRKNFLMFFLIIFIFGFLSQPPHLFFSRHFVLPMIESPAFLAGTLCLFALYWIKGMLDNYKIIHSKDNGVLYLLSLLPRDKLLLLILRQISLVMAPILIYTFVIISYSLLSRPFLSVGLLLGTSISMYVSVWFMLWQIQHPQEKVWRRDWQSKLGEWIKGSLSYVIILSLWHHSRRILLFTKSIGIALLGALSLAQDWNQKAFYLCMWSIICTQGLIFFRLRQKEDQEIFLLRNFPISRIKRWLGYLGAVCLVFIPESLLWLICGSDLKLLIHMIFAYLGMGMLVVAVLYHKALELGTFINYLLGYFIVGFVILLFGIPLFGLGLGSLILSWWIFWEEFYKWNGWNKE